MGITENWVESVFFHQWPRYIIYWWHLFSQSKPLFKFHSKKHVVKFFDFLEVSLWKQMKVWISILWNTKSFFNILLRFVFINSRMLLSIFYVKLSRTGGNLYPFKTYLMLILDILFTIIAWYLIIGEESETKQYMYVYFG